ncbi:hypothetical protein [Armatimonas sp.]|uniref:hypothetical protein n=1 Tax=Armatimonas sp. TaxID=1872638 RepID=UPI00375198A0
MATTIDELRDALHTDGPPLFYDGGQTLLYSFPHQGQMMAVYIQLDEEGGYVRFLVPCYLDLSRTAYRTRVMEKLLALNYSFKLLKFGVDPSDGEVTVQINLPLDDSQPMPLQLRRCMFYLTDAAMKERVNLLSLLETGIYPSSEDEGFCASLDQLLPDEEPLDSTQQRLIAASNDAVNAN